MSQFLKMSAYLSTYLSIYPSSIILPSIFYPSPIGSDSLQTLTDRVIYTYLRDWHVEVSECSFLSISFHLKFHAATFSCLSIHEIQSLAPQLSKNTCSAYTLPPYWFVQVEFWDDRKVCSIISYLSVNTVLYCQLSSNWKKMFHTFLSFFFWLFTIGG